MQQALVFNSENENLGLAIHNLPEHSNNEIFFKHLIKVGINPKAIKAFKVLGFPTGQSSGKAFVYFETKEAARDALFKLSGSLISASCPDKAVKCSILMDKEKLKLFNNQNVHIRNLKQDVTEKTLLAEMNQYGFVFSCMIRKNDNKRNDGYITFSSPAEAQKVVDHKIFEKLSNYPPKLLTNQVDKKPRIGFFSRNIKVEFDTPLTVLEPFEYENLIKDQVIRNYQIMPSSVYVWGNRARHAHTSQDQEAQSQACPDSVKNNFVLPQGVTVEKGSHDCYLNPETSCEKLLNARVKAFISFPDDQSAIDFVNKFYNGEVKNADQQYTFGDVTSKMLTAIPFTKNEGKHQIILEQLAKLDNFNNHFLYIGNIRDSVQEQDLIKTIEEYTKSQVMTIKIASKPNKKPARNQADPSAAPQNQNYRYATIKLKETGDVKTFLSNFKAQPEYRNQFSGIFNDDYKYVNNLKPTKIHQQENAKKREKSEQKQENPKNFLFQNQILANQFQLSQGFPNKLPLNNYGIMSQRYPNQQFPQQYRSFSANNQQFPQPNRNYNQKRPNNSVDNNNPRKPQGQKQPINKGSNQGPATKKTTGKVQPSKPIEKVPVVPKAQNQLPPLNELLLKADKDKVTILGHFLKDKVEALLPSDKKVYLNKVLGILTDLDLYNVTDIYNSINDSETLKSNVQESLDVILDETAQ